MKKRGEFHLAFVMYFIGVLIRPASILRTISVAFIYKNLTFQQNQRFWKGAENLVTRYPRNKSSLISNRDTVICNSWEFILQEFTFKIKCVIIGKNLEYAF